MLRAILEGVILFVLPFAAFAIYLVVIGQNPLQPEVWSRKALSWLTLMALAACIAGVLAVGLRREVQSGVFVPSHADKDGRFVPGGFRPAP
jgi:Family of unknown function (DUF6111)